MESDGFGQALDGHGRETIHGAIARRVRGVGGVEKLLGTFKLRDKP